jgi:hypothetical protein
MDLTKCSISATPIALTPLNLQPSNNGCGHARVEESHVYQLDFVANSIPANNHVISSTSSTAITADTQCYTIILTTGRKSPLDDASSSISTGGRKLALK